MATGGSTHGETKRDVETKIADLLREQPGQTILLSSLWTLYKAEHGYLPDPKTFGVSKRGEILEKCSFCIFGENNSKQRTVELKQVKPKKYAVSHSNHGNITQHDVEEDCDSKLNELKIQFRELLEEHPEGIARKQFFKHFSKRYGFHVRSAEYNVIDHTELLKRCDDVVEEFHDKGVLKLRVKKTKPSKARATESKSTTSEKDDKMRRRYDDGPGQPAPPGLNFLPHGPPGTQQVPLMGLIPPAQSDYVQQIANLVQVQQVQHGNSYNSRGRSQGRDRYESPYREPQGTSRGPHGASHGLQHAQSTSRAPQSFPHAPQGNAQRWDGGHYGNSGPPSKKIFVPKEQIENVAKDCIERLAESKKYVSLERIEKLILQHYNVTSLAEMNVRNIEHIKPIGDLLRVQCKINAYIQAFVKTRAIATLHELSESLRDFVASGKEFETLNLGPLVEQPLIYEYFKFPTNGEEIPDLTTEDIIEFLRVYLTENSLWTTHAELEGFMAFLNEKNGTTNPFQLGIRIRSLPLAIQCLKRAQRESGQSIRAAIASLKLSAENDLTAAFTTFTHSLLIKEPGICQVRQEYLRMTPKAFVAAFFQKLNVLYTSVNYLQQNRQEEVGRGKAKDLRKSQDAIHLFLSRLQQDKLLQKLFQVAVNCAQSEIHLQLQEILSPSSAVGSGLSPGATEGGSGQEDTNTKTKPTLSELVRNVKKYIERCLSQGLTMAHFARIENKILEDMDFPHFHALGHGSFLDIISKNEQIKQFLEDSGAGSLGLSPGGSTSKMAYHLTHEDLACFLHQCGIADAHMVEDALCYHYGSPDGKSLGHGSMANLMQSHSRQPDKGANSAVVYGSALVAKSASPLLVRERSAGVLGHQTRDRALACLENCPLLEDMHDWSHWDVVFEPELGDLKTFVLKYGNWHSMSVMDKDKKAQLNTAILAFETKPGCLLKITAKTSADQMASAALQGDARGTCGHLVSLVVSHKGVENTSLVLLGNHVKTALYKMQANRDQDAVKGTALAAEFVVNCLLLLPSVICVSVAQKVFLEPLSEVIGQKKSQKLLMDHATSPAARGRLQLLGMLLGYEDWGHNFSERTAYPGECVENLEGLGDLPADVIRIDSEESESESAVSDSDIDEILSGDDLEVLESEASAQEVDESTAESAGDVVDVSTDNDIEAKDKTNQVDEVSLLDDTISAPVNKYEQIIEEIRRDEFGIGVTLGGEDAERLWDKQQERLGRTLDRLSKDLYSKDTHFVLELIQNADDNSYPEEFMKPDSGIRASVKFVIDMEAITILNNECGFEEKNIRAICDVGRSTKGKHKYGYIGQKGIGFKSVFRVTDTPEIHSNGYHIQFDVNSGPTGYILPHWIGTDTDGEEEDRKAKDRWTTKIVLPLKSDVDMQSTQSLAARFHDVHPSLLLFLHRLKNMTVVNKVEDYTLKVRRQDLGDNIIEIKHSKGVDRWFVVKKSLDARKISLQAKSGVDVVSTEIAMAFPLQSQEQIRAQVLPQKQPVFAFLPLRSYGFRFVVQGDFDVPSSREDVDRDSLWNQWLSSELHHLFVDALQAFKEHPDFSQVEAVCRFLQFVPLEGEILDFFQPIASQIMQLLRAQPCLPSVGLLWRLPSQLVYTRDPILQSVLPSSVLRDHLSLDYLHPEVASTLNPTLRDSLGVQTMSLTHLLEIRKTMLASQQQGTATDDDIIHTAKWLTCIYRAMDDLQGNEEVISCLRKLPTMPLASGQMVSLDEQALFFPLKKDPQKSKEQDLLLALSSDLNTIHPLLLQGLDSVANSQVYSLLELVGVKRLTPQDITHHHILPVLRAEEKWKSKSRDLLLSYMVYIKEQLERDASLINTDELRETAVLLTNHGPQKPSEVSIHFTPAYLSRIDLRKLLPGYDWIFVDARYLVGSTQEKHIHRWRDFFSKLGVLEFLALKSSTVTLTKEELKSSPWQVYSDLLPEQDSYKVADVQCEEFEALVLHNKSPETVVEQSRVMFQVLDQAWDNMYSGGTTITNICDSEGNPLKEVDTSFAHNLRHLAWVPAVVGVEDQEGDYQLMHRLMCPGELFVHKPEIFKLLNFHVPYLEPNFSEKSSFTQFLGVHFHVKRDFIRDKLISWCDRDDDNVDEPRSFTTSLEHMREVYQYLQANLLPSELEALLSKYPVIFTIQSREAFDKPEVPSRGLFRARHEVRWAEPSGLFEKHKESVKLLDHQGVISKPLLCLYYPKDLKDFFLKCAKIQKFPSVEEYTQLLVLLTMTAPPSKDPADVLQILSVIGNELKSTQEKSEDGARLAEQFVRNVKCRIGDNKCLPGKSRASWVSLTEKPLIADDKTFERMFQGMEGVVFLDCAEKLRVVDRKKSGRDQYSINSESIQFLYHTLGVELLSKCVEIQPTTEMYAPCPDLQIYVGQVIGFIQRLLVASHPEIYETLKSKNVGSILASMTFGQVGKLELVYSLVDRPELVPVVQPEVCQIVDDNQFTIHRDHVKSLNDVNRELARYFSLGDKNCARDLKSMLMDAMEYPQRSDQKFLDQHELFPLPDGEEPWTIPVPVVYMPPPPVYTPQSSVEMQPMETSQAEGVTAADGTAPEGGGIRAWPPQSSSAPPDSKATRPSGTSMWPPPKPPEHVDHTRLPDNLRPSRLVHRQDDGDGPRQAPGERLTPEAGQRESHALSPHSGDANRTPRSPISTEFHRSDSNMSTHSGKPATDGNVTNVVVINDGDEEEESRVAPHGGHRGGPRPRPTSPMEQGENRPSGEQTGAIVGPRRTEEVASAEPGSEVQQGHHGYNDPTTWSGEHRIQPHWNQNYEMYPQPPVFFGGTTTWTDDCTDVMYEDLSQDSAPKVPSDIRLGETSDEAEIGRWGEHLVNEYLVSRASQPGSDIVYVNWINMEGETGKPYDFMVHLRDDRSGEEREVYIEVKSTLSNKKAFFEISSQEFQFAQSARENFHLYRVFNAGAEVGSVRLKKLENLAAKMDAKQVRLCMVV